MALSRARNTPRREHLGYHRFTPAAGVTIYPGGLTALNADGNAVPGATSTTLTVVGRAKTGTAEDATGVDLERGTFAWGNSGADPITKADWGKQVFIVDDETVARTNGSGTRSVAGICRGLTEAGGVWVES